MPLVQLLVSGEPLPGPLGDGALGAEALGVGTLGAEALENWEGALIGLLVVLTVAGAMVVVAVIGPESVADVSADGAAAVGAGGEAGDGGAEGPVGAGAPLGPPGTSVGATEEPLPMPPLSVGVGKHVETWRPAVKDANPSLFSTPKDLSGRDPT